MTVPDLWRYTRALEERVRDLERTVSGLILAQATLVAMVHPQLHPPNAKDFEDKYRANEKILRKAVEKKTGLVVSVDPVDGDIFKLSFWERT